MGDKQECSAPYLPVGGGRSREGFPPERRGAEGVGRLHGQDYHVEKGITGAFSSSMRNQSPGDRHPMDCDQRLEVAYDRKTRPFQEFWTGREPTCRAADGLSMQVSRSILTRRLRYHHRCRIRVKIDGMDLAKASRKPGPTTEPAAAVLSN